VAAGTQLIRLAIFGQPVAQSLSPRIHPLFAKQFDLQVDYRAIEATPATFPALVAELAAQGGRGCNITVPLKSEAWRLAATSSETAQRAQAANTLLFETRDYWVADNTDGPGLVADLESGLGCDLSGARICLLGAGGAAAGVLGPLLNAGPDCVVIANRTVDRARRLARGHDDLGALQTARLSEVAAHAPFDLVINATSLGHQGRAPEIEASWLRPGGLCYDMNYGAAAAPLADHCALRGIRYSDGLGMLVRQAALSFCLWTGRKPETADVLTQLRGSLPTMSPSSSSSG
jgi:shikimate dehydrogenase